MYARLYCQQKNLSTACRYQRSALSDLGKLRGCCQCRRLSASGTAWLGAGSLLPDAGSAGPWFGAGSLLPEAGSAGSRSSCKGSGTSNSAESGRLSLPAESQEKLSGSDDSIEKSVSALDRGMRRPCTSTDEGRPKGRPLDSGRDT